MAEWGAISREQILKAEDSACARGVSLETVLLTENKIPKYLLVQALAKHYDRPCIEYDERLPIPPNLLEGLDPAVLAKSLWMPVIQKRDGMIVVAANNPESLMVQDECRRFLQAERCEFRVALEEDIIWYIQDFLHAAPEQLIGSERTGLAFWRNTMTQWRTRLACYRTDLAGARTGLAFLRWGLGTIAIADTFLKSNNLGNSPHSSVSIGLLILGLSVCSYGLKLYLKVRRSRMSPPADQTIVEVTAATLLFLENYHLLKNTGIRTASRDTMLARLSDLLADHCTILYPSPSSRVRTMYVHERNVLAAHRTIAACYRTIYARARTGLAFIRTGFSCLSIGLALLLYFGTKFYSALDILLILAGILMCIDGTLWYMPVRKEQAEMPRSPAYR